MSLFQLYNNLPSHLLLNTREQCDCYTKTLDGLSSSGQTRDSKKRPPRHCVRQATDPDPVWLGDRHYYHVLIIEHIIKGNDAGKYTSSRLSQQHEAMELESGGDHLECNFYLWVFRFVQPHYLPELRSS